MHPCVLLARCGSNVSNKSHHDRQRMSCHAYKASLILITFNPISPTIYSSHEEPRKQGTPSVSSSYVSHLHIPPSISNPRISSDQNATATSQIMTIVTWRQKPAQSKQKIMHGHGLSLPCWVTQVFVRLLRGKPRSWEPRSHTITCSLPCRNARECRRCPAVGRELVLCKQHLVLDTRIQPPVCVQGLFNDSQRTKNIFRFCQTRMSGHARPR